MGKTLQRFRKLRVTDAISQQELDVTEADWRTAQSQLDQAEQNLRDSRLVAAKDGVVLARYVSRYEEERVEQAEAVNAGREAVTVATDRYKEGKASYYEVLEAQQQLYPAENALSEIEAGRRLAIVQLYKALGGGWSLKDSEWADATARVSSSNPGSAGH
jgi:multidrug efflux system outer membrane protein